MRKIYPSLLTALSPALALACNQAFAESAAPGAASASAHSKFHPSTRHHHRDRRNVGTFVPATDGVFWGSPSYVRRHPLNIQIRCSL